MIAHDYKDINDVDKLHNIIQSHESQINILQEQIKCLTDKIYGRKSEKIIDSTYQQLPLFDILEPEFPIADGPEEITISSHKRKVSAK